jgi:hypothetical protein
MRNGVYYRSWAFITKIITDQTGVNAATTQAVGAMIDLKCLRLYAQNVIGIAKFRLDLQETNRCIAVTVLKKMAEMTGGMTKEGIRIQDVLAMTILDAQILKIDKCIPLFVQNAARTVNFPLDQLPEGRFFAVIALRKTQLKADRKKLYLNLLKITRSNLMT